MAIIVQGTDAVIQALKALGPQAENALASTLYEIGEEIMAVSKEQYVPVDTGTLRSTGYVEPPVMVGGVTSVALGYGGPAAPYALSVHENPRAGVTGGVSPKGKPYRHWARVGEWKYLETPWKEMSGRLVNRLEVGLKAKVRAVT